MGAKGLGVAVALGRGSAVGGNVARARVAGGGAATGLPGAAADGVLVAAGVTVIAVADMQPARVMTSNASKVRVDMLPRSYACLAAAIVAAS